MIRIVRVGANCDYECIYCLNNVRCDKLEDFCCTLFRCHKDFIIYKYSYVGANYESLASEDIYSNNSKRKCTGNFY